MATKASGVATGRFLNVHFKPSLKEVQQDFHRLRSSLSYKEAVMGVAMGIAREEIEEMFDEKHDAMGKPWKPWKETYPPSGATPYAQRARSLPNVNGILERKGGLREAATNSNAFTITGDRLTYGSDLPSWAGTHLHGGKKVYNGGYKIPQRSFYPYSAAGVTRVKRVFDAWAVESIAVLTRGKGSKKVTWVQTRGMPGNKGQFGPKPF